MIAFYLTVTYGSGSMRWPPVRSQTPSRGRRNWMLMRSRWALS